MIDHHLDHHLYQSSKRKRNRHHRRRKSKKEQKDEDNLKSDIQTLYIFAIIIWIIIIFYFRLYNADPIGIVIISVVFIVFIINWKNPRLGLNPNEFGVGFLSLALAFLLAFIINWNIIQEAAGHIEVLLFLGVVFLLLSLIEIENADTSTDLTEHLRVIFHTYSIILFILAVYAFYSGEANIPSTNSIPATPNANSTNNIIMRTLRIIE